MDIRRAAGCVAALLISCSAATARAENDKRIRSTASQIQALQGEISDPADCKNFVEGSQRLPEGAAVPRTQLWPESSGRTAAGRSALSPSLPGLSPRPERIAVIPPAPAFTSQPRAPVAANLQKLPPAGVAIFSLVIVGLFALSAKREFASEPAAEALPAEPLAAAPGLDAPALGAPAAISAPQAPLIETPAGRSILARLEAAPEPFIDTRMPVSTWRAITLREQQLIELWDASPEKALGRASFEEWLDAQGSVEGVDVPLLKTKLDRDA